MIRCHHCFNPVGDHAVFCPVRSSYEFLNASPVTLFDDQAVRVGEYALFPLYDDETVEARPSRGQPISAASARTWRVVGPDDVDLVLGDIRWPTGERLVRVLRRLGDGHPRFDSIVGRVGLPLERVADGRWMFFLKQARLNNRERPTLCKATPEQLSAGAGGVPVLHVLCEQFGLLDWGRADEIASHRNNLSATLAGVMTDDSLAHVAAFVLTRVAPTARNFDGTLAFA